MRTIELERVNFFIGSTALLEVYIDGEKCGELKNGGSLKQILDENDHTIQFSMNIRINHQEYRRMFYNVIRLEKNGNDRSFQICMQGGKLNVMEISN
ncbi:hypothetical protein [Frisingicoccus sp.]|uniref:hypothetical protein n=1 Tax=Frisingicoccus sp. TaxID=1918627 RepID=UPI0015C08882